MTETKACTKCKLEQPLSDFHANKKTRDGRAQRCKSCVREVMHTRYEAKKAEILDYHRKYRAENKGKLKAYAQAHKAEHNARKKGIGGRFSSYKTSAKGKGLAWELSKEQFTLLVQSPCAYCGTEGRNGVDRVDSSLGYTVSNVVPCCTTCNFMKLDHSVDDFIAHCRRIVAFNKG